MFEIQFGSDVVRQAFTRVAKMAGVFQRGHGALGIDRDGGLWDSTSCSVGEVVKQFIEDFYDEVTAPTVNWGNPQTVSSVNLPEYGLTVTGKVMVEEDGGLPCTASEKEGLMAAYERAKEYGVNIQRVTGTSWSNDDCLSAGTAKVPFLCGYSIRWKETSMYTSWQCRYFTTQVTKRCNKLKVERQKLRRLRKWGERLTPMLDWIKVSGLQNPYESYSKLEVKWKDSKLKFGLFRDGGAGSILFSVAFFEEGGQKRALVSHREGYTNLMHLDDYEELVSELIQ